MKTFYALVGLMFLPLLAGAQPDAGTATVTVTLDDLVGQVPGVIDAFSAGGVLAGVAAILGLAMAALNLGPLRRALGPNSDLDWLRPLLMLLLMGASAGIGSALAGASVLASVVAGIVAGLSSGYLQRLVQELRD